MFEARLRSRAEQTPLLLGVRGNDYDLVLHALYFRNVLTDRLRMGDWNQINQREGILAIPCATRFEQGHAPSLGRRSTISTFASSPLPQGIHLPSWGNVSWVRHLLNRWGWGGRHSDVRSRERF